MSKEHAYAYEAGYRDGSTHYELEHCPACKNVADLQEALAENAKLREYVNAMAIQSYKGRMFDCGYCPFYSQCYNDEPKEHQGRGCQWWLWARELGIEVNE